MICFCRLWVEGYGRFREPTEWHFQPGLNIVTGCNEAGKTTVLSALLDALYENPFSTAKDLHERIAWNHSRGWQLQLDLQSEARAISLYKHYPLDPKSSRTRVLLTMDEQQLEDKLALQHWESFWDMPKPVYLATACVRQRELDRLQQDKPVADLQASLRASATAADLNRIYKMLGDRVRVLSTSRTSELKKLETAIQEMERDRQEAKRRHTERQAARERMRTIEMETEGAGRQLAELEGLLAVWRQVQESQRKRDELKAREKGLFDRLEQLRRLNTRFDGLAHELESFGNFGLLPDDLLEQCARMQERLKRANEEKTKIETEMERLQHEADKDTGKRKASMGLIVTGIALLIAAGVFFLQSAPVLAAAVGSAGVLVILAWLLSRKHNPTLAAQIESLQERLKSAREEVVQAQDELTRLLRRAGFEGESLEAETTLLKERWEGYQGKLREQQNLLSERQGLLAGGSPEAWHEELRDTASERMAHEKELEKPAARAVLQESPARLIRLESEVEDLRRRYQSMLEDRLRLEGQLSNGYEGADPEELGLQLDALQAKHRSLTRQSAVVELTRELLRETDERYIHSLGTYLTPEIESVLETITGDRYGRVQVGGDLSFTAYHPERADWLPLEMGERAWSAGTLDQLFFACRLGLSRALSGQRSLPLLLDDPFVHYDPVRLNRTVEFLSELSHQCQILLFTCRPNDYPGRVHLVNL